MAKGAIIKFISLFVRAIQFGCSAVILGIFSYFLATLANHDLPVNNHAKATEGISGAATLYTIIGFLLVCCLGGITLFGYLSILLDFAFAGAFGYIAWVNRNGASKCTGIVDTPYGYGAATPGNRIQDDDGFTNVPSFRTACRLQTAAFSVAIIGGVFFLLSIPLSLLLVKNHKKEKAFGPGPKNNYNATGGRRKFWQKKNKRADPEYGMAGGKSHHHNDTLPAHSTPHDARTSYATDTTAVGEQGVGYNKYNTTPAHTHAHTTPHGHHAYEAPTGTAVPPQSNIGYNRTTAGNF